MTANFAAEAQHKKTNGARLGLRHLPETAASSSECLTHARLGLWNVLGNWWRRRLCMWLLLLLFFLSHVVTDDTASSGT